MSFDTPKDQLHDEETAVEQVAESLEETEEFSASENPFAAFENPEIRTKEDVEGTRKRKKLILTFSMIGAFVLLVVLIVLLIFVFPAKETVDPTTTVDTSVVLLDKTNADGENAATTTAAYALISSATFKGAEETVEIINKDGSLFVKGYEDVPMNAINMGDLALLLTKFTALDDIGEVENLADFGLDKPQLTVTVNYSDDTQMIWEIGDLAPDQTGCYLREKDSKHVYILSTENVAILMQRALDYVSTTVFSEPDIETTSEGTSEVVLRKMTLSGAVRNGEDFSFRLVTSEDSDAYIYYTYIITEPFLKGANSSYDTQLEAFTSLGAYTVLAVNPTDEDLKNYGFDDPYSVLNFTLAQRTTISGATEDGNTVSTTTHKDLVEHTLYITKADSDYYYVMVDDNPIIYLVPVSDIPFAAMQYDDFADTLLFLEDITQMETFHVNVADGKETVFELSHNSSITDTEKNMTVVADGKTYDTMDFRYLINNFMAIERYGSLTQDITNLPLAMEFSITRLNETEPVLTVKFYKVSSSLYAAVLSHGEEYLVKAADVTFVIEQYENYLNGDTVLRK